MSRYVNADAFIAMERELYCKDCDNYNGILCRSCRFNDVLSDLDDYADAYAVDMVRCKDCTEHQHCKLEQRLGWYGYCSDGERKETI